jgi:hypothetical protein
MADVEGNKHVSKLIYKPVGFALGAVAGMTAGFVFRHVWQIVARSDDVPDATDEERGWGEVLAAAALQGAIFAIVRAAVDRGGAVGVRRLTGRWPA